MANPVLDELQTAVTNITGVVASAVALINGIAARVQSAVDAAIANGATAEQLKPVTDEVAALNASSKTLGDAVAANTSPV